MFGQMRTSALGMMAGQTMLDVTSHNVANVNTAGYRAGRTDFAELAYAGLHEVDGGAPRRGAAPVGVESAPVEFPRGHGVGNERVVLSEKSGALQSTGVPTDLAVAGAGYFPLVDFEGNPAGYTRDGSFRKDASGHLVHVSGGFLADESGEALRLAEDRGPSTLGIAPDGRVTSIEPDGTEEELGRLVLTVPRAGQRLVAGGGNTYYMVGDDGVFGPGDRLSPGEEAGEIRQGFLEGSNADLAEEMTRLIMAQRAFGLNARSLQTADQMFEMANHLGR